MMPMSRRKGIAFLVLVSVIIGAAGCLTGGDDRQYLDNRAYPPYPQGGSGVMTATTSPPQLYGTTGVTPASAMTTTTPNGTVVRAQFAQMPNGDEKIVGEPPMGMQGPGMSPAMIVQANPPLPTEKGMFSHPPHRVAPPDILWLESLRLVPKGPYKLLPLEVVQVDVGGDYRKVLKGDEIKGLYRISPEGTINLGNGLRPIPIAGMTVDAAQQVIAQRLGELIKGNLSVVISLIEMRGLQNIKGEHLVRPDGTISLGMYGSVYVAGMTLGQVKATVEQYLRAYLIDPQVSVDVFAYNSRKIYIIADGAGYGQQVIAIPATGGETVLDAIARVQGLPQVASLKKIWVARPSPAGHPCSQVLPVDWKAITQAGRTETNYELFPGDRIYISSDPLICAYNYIDKLVAPIERILSVTLLGASVAQTFRGNGTSSGFIVAK